MDAAQVRAKPAARDATGVTAWPLLCVRSPTLTPPPCFFSNGWRLFRVLALWDGATLGRCLSQTIPIFVGNTHPDRDIECALTREEGALGSASLILDERLLADAAVPRYRHAARDTAKDKTRR